MVRSPARRSYHAHRHVSCVSVKGRAPRGWPIDPVPLPHVAKQRPQVITVKNLVLVALVVVGVSICLIAATGPRLASETGTFPGGE